jgi:hypothetical protein
MPECPKMKKYFTLKPFIIYKYNPMKKAVEKYNACVNEVAPVRSVSYSEMRKVKYNLSAFVGVGATSFIHTTVLEHKMENKPCFWAGLDLYSPVLRGKWGVSTQLHYVQWATTAVVDAYDIPESREYRYTSKDVKLNLLLAKNFKLASLSSVKIYGGISMAMDRIEVKVVELSKTLSSANGFGGIESYMAGIGYDKEFRDVKGVGLTLLYEYNPIHFLHLKEGQILMLRMSYILFRKK